MSGSTFDMEGGTFRGLAVRRENWTIAGQSFDLTWPADMDALLDLPRTQERFKKDEYMPYWAQPWPVSVLLAEAVLRGRAGESRPAVEIGCGVGVVSIAAAAMGWSVTATDYDADAAAFARLNAERNGVSLAGCGTLDYREPLAAPAYEFILGSDLLYERNKSAPVAGWIASALLPGGEAWIADPNRSAADAFETHLRTVGLAAELDRVEMTAPSGLLTRGRIWRVRWAASAE